MASRPLSVDEFAEITMGRHQWLDMDPLTFSKIVQAQLENIEPPSCRGKGKQRAGTVTDAQLALQVYVDGLAHSDDVTSSHSLARRVSEASLPSISAIEDGARRDQRFDQEDYEFTFTPPDRGLARVSRRSMMQELQRKEADPLKELWPALMDSDSEESLVAAESSTWAAAQNVRQFRSKRMCIACGEQRLVRDLAIVPCKQEHEYCRNCLSRVVELAIEDESFFPPKCDGEIIPLHVFDTFLPRSLVDQYQSKALEYETKDRTYCYESTCAAFIPPDSIDELSPKCPKCRKTTCIVCKSAGHFGDCVGDEAMRQLKETANVKRWQTCYMCNSIVQLEHGCNHITCRCGTQFCYACGAKWKTCDCEHWEDDDLLSQSVTHFVDTTPPLPPRPTSRHFIESPPPLPPRPTKGSSPIPRRLRKPLARTDSKLSRRAIGQNITAPQYGLSAPPTAGVNIPSSDPKTPGLFAGRMQCAIQ